MMGRDVFGKWGEFLKILRGGDPARDGNDAACGKSNSTGAGTQRLWRARCQRPRSWPDGGTGVPESVSTCE